MITDEASKAQEEDKAKEAIEAFDKTMDRQHEKSPWPGLVSVALAALIGLILILVGALAVDDATVQAGLIATGTTLVLGSGVLKAGQSIARRDD